MALPVPTQAVVTSAGLTTGTTPYTAGDQAGTEIDLGPIGTTNGYVLITDITMVDYSARINAHEIRLYGAATTPATDNLAASWSDADQLKRVHDPISASSFVIDSLNQTIGYSFQPFLAKCDGSGHLWLDVVLRAIPTSSFFSAVTDLHYTVNGFQVS